jgi:biotin carboxyl carrier protein
MEKKLRITVEGRVYDVTVEDLSDTGGMLYPGAGSMTIPAPPAREAAPRAAATAAPTAAPAASSPRGGAPGDVVATLGGVVDSVPVTVGQTVKQGDAVVVLEAMKMKSPMVAPREGKVARIAVKAGDAVEAGQVLATIA